MAQIGDGQPDRLGTRLRVLRRRAGLTGDQLAAALGWVQSRVSRIETGRQVPTEDDVRAWVAATGGDDAAAADDLVASIPDERAAITTWKARLRGESIADVQVDYAALDRDATVIRGVEVAIIPGLLQTSGYARAMLQDAATYFDLDDAAVEAGVVARLQRQTILYERDRRFEFVITEAAIRTRVAPDDVMAGQLDRLLTLSTLPTVTIGILPIDAPIPTVPLMGYGMWDDLAVVETYDTEILLHSDDAAVYGRVFEHLAGAAATGDEARQLILRASGNLHRARQR